MPTRTKFVSLMHPYEFKRVKANTGRLTHLCLTESAIHMGIGFDADETVQALINDPQNYPVMLYPTSGARDLSKGELHAADFAGRRLVVFLLDATCGWPARSGDRAQFAPTAANHVFACRPEPLCHHTAA